MTTPLTLAERKRQQASRVVTVKPKQTCWCGEDPCPYKGRHPNYMLVTGPSGFPEPQRLLRVFK